MWWLMFNEHLRCCGCPIRSIAPSVMSVVASGRYRSLATHVHGCIVVCPRRHGRSMSCNEARMWTQWATWINISITFTKHFKHMYVVAITSTEQGWIVSVTIIRLIIARRRMWETKQGQIDIFCFSFRTNSMMGNFPKTHRKEATAFQ